jgi:hypothetical protein
MSSDWTGHNCSSLTPNPSRLVARIVMVAEAARIASTRSATLSTTCSQLSNTSNRTLPSSAEATDSVTVLPGCWVMPNTAATASGTAAGFGDRGQLEKPGPVGEFIGPPRGDFQRQAGLADPTYPGQRDQPMSIDRGLHLVKFGLTPDEAADRRPQVPRTRIQRPQRRKIGLQARRSDLKCPDRRRHVPQPSRPQIQQIHSTEQTRRRLDQQDLTTMPGCHHSCGAIEHRTEVVPVSQLGLAGCQSHRQLQLPLRGVHGGHRRREGRHDTVARVAEQEPVIRLDRRAQHLVVDDERRPHRLRVGLPPTGGTLHIGEQKRHHPRRSSRRISGHPSRISQQTRSHLTHRRNPTETPPPRGSGHLYFRVSNLGALRSLRRGYGKSSSPHVRWGSGLLDLAVTRGGSCSRMLSSLWGRVAGFVREF